MSIFSWLTGGRADGQATAQLEAELHELLALLAPQVRSGALRSLAVTCVQAREGATTSAVYVSELLADNLDGRVLLVDANTQHPDLHHVYHTDRDPGLAEVLRGELELRAAVRGTLRENQDLLPAGAGSADVGDVVGRRRVEDLLTQARLDYSVVVLDAGALLASPEAVVFCHSTAAVLLTVLAGGAQGEVLARGSQLLKRGQATLLGVVVNDPRGEFYRDES